MAAIVVCLGAAAHFLLVLLASFGNMPDLRQVFIPSARAAYAGVTLYHPLPIGAPGVFTVGTSGAVDTPPFLLLIWPWTVLGDAQGQVAWAILQVAALVATIAITYKGIGRPTTTELLVVTSVVMFLGPVRDSLEDGQVSTILGALMAMAMLNHQRGRPALGGMALGLAGAVKLTPLLTLPYFAWKRDFRMCVWSLGTAVALFAASIASGRVRGFTAFPGVISQLSSGTAAAQNQSLSGLILRFLLPDRTAFPIVPPAAAVRLVVIAAQLAVLALLVVLVRRVVLDEPLRAWTQFSVVLLVLPALQPFAWPHHWAWAVLAVPVCVHLCSRRLVHPAAAVAMAGTYLLVTLFEFPLFAAANATAANPRLDPLLALGASLTLFGVLAVALLVVLGSRRQPAGA
jgi:hypothetical protein